jgi:hypothetical protein
VSKKSVANTFAENRLDNCAPVVKNHYDRDYRDMSPKGDAKKNFPTCNYIINRRKYVNQCYSTNICMIDIGFVLVRHV